MSSQRLLLNVGVNSTGYHGRSWRTPHADWDRFVSFEHYLRVAELAHRGGLDALFLSDHPALQAIDTDRPLHSLDPIVLFTALAARVPDIGFVLTASSSYNSPYNLARRLASLDHISGGRVIWNVVSSFNPDIAANFGAAPLDSRERRYRRADEFVSVVKALWRSWDLRSIPEPAEFGQRLWDAGPIDHHGEFFDVRGPLNVPIGPQGHPLIAQAGGSPAGVDLAGKHADIVYAALLGKDAAREFRAEVRARAEAHGRDPESVRLLPGLVPVVAETTEAALRRHERLNGHADEDALLAGFADRHGIPLDRVGPDSVLAPELFTADADQQRPIGFTRSLHDLLATEPLTLRQLARRVEGGHRLVVGTPAEVADRILDWWRAGVVDGYTLQPPVLPEDLEIFVREVVPLLRDARGPDYTEPTVRARFGIPDPAAAAAR